MRGHSRYRGPQGWPLLVCGLNETAGQLETGLLQLTRRGQTTATAKQGALDPGTAPRRPGDGSDVGI